MPSSPSTIHEVMDIPALRARLAAKASADKQTAYDRHFPELRYQLDQTEAAEATVKSNQAKVQQGAAGLGAATTGNIHVVANDTPTAPVAPAPTKADRLGSILKGIAAIAAELGPEFIHSAAGIAFLDAGEVALAVIGEFL